MMKFRIYLRLNGDEGKKERRVYTVLRSTHTRTVRSDSMEAEAIMFCWGCV